MIKSKCIKFKIKNQITIFVTSDNIAKKKMYPLTNKPLEKQKYTKVPL